MITTELPLLGFGEYFRSSDITFKKKIELIAEVALVILAFDAALFAVATFPILVIPAGITVSSGSIIASVVGGVFVSSSIASVIHYTKYQKGLAKSTAKLMSEIPVPPPLGTFSRVEGIPLNHGKESFLWKKKLIAHAEHNIVLSGSYCGGEAFDETLDLIEEQMKAKPELKAIIISSDQFINGSNSVRIEKLSREFPDRFHLEKTPLMWSINPGLKWSTNHTKALVIDYGKYFLLGGSGLQNSYAHCIGLGEDEGLKSEKSGLFGKMLANGYRDQDFVFSSKEANGIGRSVFIETLKLAYRWNGITHDYEGKKREKMIVDLLREEPQEVATEIEEFHADSRLSPELQTKIFCTGPEHVFNAYEHEMVKRINNAKSRILISHLFFHPNRAVFDALLKAAQRGVKITIVTNGFTQKISPLTHQFFGPRSEYHLAKLMKREKNIECRLFNVAKTSLHKKVMVIDDAVLAGSSNLGYKSLVTMSDHEINFVTEGKEFADRTVEIIEVDQRYSAPFKDSSLKFYKALLALRFWLIAPLIG